ncbi:MAG: hypothetical protein HY235_09905 [Acidobacteria bacterium]|nr:hypothetical protein [Acidobacteriota bacterium]
MKQTIEIRAVDLVRRIRDAQAEQLADKSVAEVMEFFNRAAERARERSGVLGGVPKPSNASTTRCG